MIAEVYEMKFVVIGLGSMGKRRIRCLLSLGEKNIIGIDIIKERRKIAEENYGIVTYEKIEYIQDISDISAFIISVPPDQHMKFAHFAIDNDIHCFIEASVVDDKMIDLMQKEKLKDSIKICPSCTMRFHPSIKLIKKIIDEKQIGELSNFSYHSGQYLPDWHPWEKMESYYVSKKETGACREIVPFELTWLNWVFGEPKNLFGYKAKTIDLNLDIDDVYAVTLEYTNGVLGTLLVDVVSRMATRKITINGDKGQIYWDWNRKQVEVYYASEKRMVTYSEPEGNAAIGYNNNIIEEMYIDEIRSFIDAIDGKREFPNALSDDYQILQYLYKIENSNADR